MLAQAVKVLAQAVKVLAQAVKVLAQAVKILHKLSDLTQDANFGTRLSTHVAHKMVSI